jgi:hypothetical protein
MSALVVIPTKSNLSGLSRVVGQLVSDPAVGKLVVVADGPDALRAVESLGLDPLVLVESVPEGSGIHVMWNLGLESRPRGSHALFLNDDVVLGPAAVGRLEAFLDAFPTVGIVSPSYASETLTGDYRAVHGTCRGLYDGTGGLGGFCMMLRDRLAETWRFDERMKWWYGDDDVLNWVLSRGYEAGITSWATCLHEHSVTIRENPPADFAATVERDRLVFEMKWSNGAH